MDKRLLRLSKHNIKGSIGISFSTRTVSNSPTPNKVTCEIKDYQFKGSKHNIPRCKQASNNWVSNLTRINLGSWKQHDRKESSLIVKSRLRNSDFLHFN